MVPSSAITAAVNVEHLTCGGFSFSKTVHLLNFEFIADYFGSLSLSSRRGNSRTAFMGSTRSGTPSPRWAMKEDSAEEFLTTSSGEGGFGLPLPGGAESGLRPCHTPDLKSRTKASIHVPRMFKSHAQQQYDKQMKCFN
jgi:hypothetical protein